MTQKPGRNDRCPCGSGKKYKQCCLKKEKPRPLGTRRFKATVLNNQSAAKPVQENHDEETVMCQEGDALFNRVYPGVVQPTEEPSAEEKPAQD